MGIGDKRTSASAQVRRKQAGAAERKERVRGRETGVGLLRSDMHARRHWSERLFRRAKAFRLRWEHLHHVSLATIALIAVAVFFVLGVVLRLAMGPVSLGPFSDRLRTSVLNALPGLAVRYDDAAVEWSRDEGRVNLIIVGARIFDRQHHIIAQAPKAEIGLAAGAFIRGEVQIRRIALV